MLQPFEILANRIPIRLGGFVMVLFGLVPFLFSLSLASQSLFWLIKGVPATGTVVRLATSQDDKGNITYYPVISFKTASGATVEFQSSVGGNSPGYPYPVGETLPIRYDQSHPQNAQIADFASLGLLPIFLFSVGILFLFIVGWLALRRPGSRFSIRFGYVFGVFFMVVGLLFLVSGFVVAAQTRQLEQYATATATGTVIDCVYNNTSQRTCIPTIRFTPANGAAVTFNPSSYDDNLKLGESVSVRYNPADPNEAQLASSSNALLFSFGGLGGLFFLIGLTVEITTVRNRYRPDTGMRSATSTGTGVWYGIKIQSPIALFCILLFFAIIFFGVGVILLNQSISFQHTATASATGTIVSCTESTSVNNSNGSTTTAESCTPTIRFVTREGRTIEFIASESSSSFEVGQSIPVIYNPHAPEDAQVSSFFSL